MFRLSRKIAWAWLRKMRDAMVDPGRARLAPVGCASKEALQTWVSDYLAEGPHTRTDGLNGYDGLEHAYEHDVDVIGKDGKKAVEKFLPV